MSCYLVSKVKACCFQFVIDYYKSRKENMQILQIHISVLFFGRIYAVARQPDFLPDLEEDCVDYDERDNDECDKDHHLNTILKFVFALFDNLSLQTRSLENFSSPRSHHRLPAQYVRSSR